MVSSCYVRIGSLVFYLLVSFPDRSSQFSPIVTAQRQRRPRQVPSVLPWKLFDRSDSAIGRERERQHQFSKVNRASNRQTQLRWIAQGVQKMYENGSDIPLELVGYLEALSNSKTQDQVARIGNQLSIFIQNKKLPAAVQERVIKAAATTGLFQLAHNLTREMLAEGILPSEITQDALCSSLRRAGRINQIQTLMGEMGVVAKRNSEPVSLTSFNLMLAAMCDFQSTTKFNQNRDPSALIDSAWTWISEENRAKESFGIEPSADSYGTILQAAARNGNRTLADAAWKKMQESAVLPNSFAYNARLKLAGKGSLPRDEEMLQIWGEIQGISHLQPDRYMIDSVLPVLSRKGETSQIKTILDDFVVQNSQQLVSDTFSAFLITLTNTGETETARYLFEFYVRPSFAPVFSGLASTIRLVKPTTKHFNIILDGYTRDIEMSNKRQKMADNYAGEATTQKLKRAAWDLYDDLLACRLVGPDEYTLSIMMGLASSSKEIFELIDCAFARFQIFSDVLQRAAITSLGEIGDASSACWLFARFMLTSDKTSIREWNVLLGALSKSALTSATESLNMQNAPAAAYFGSKQFSDNAYSFVNQVDGLSAAEGTAKILQLLVSESAKLGTDRVKPDSQSFCLVASALQHGEMKNATEMNSARALSLFRQSQEMGVPADGRLINAILRGFGPDVKGAISAWKEEIRPSCVAFEKRTRTSSVSPRRKKGKNLLAAYNGLIYCTGRALRPDIGLRLVYAMVKEGLEPNEVTLNSYLQGKRMHQSTVQENRAASFARKITLVDPYESLLFVECTKYDKNDLRRIGEQRVRIIV